MDHFIKKENYKGMRPNPDPHIMDLQFLKGSKYMHFYFFSFLNDICTSLFQSEIDAQLIDLIRWQDRRLLSRSSFL